MVRIKSEKEIADMRIACEAVATVLKELKNLVQEGNNAYDIERYVLERLKQLNVKPAFKGYRGYKYATCVSVNHEILHGAPLKTKVFKKGDIVSIDVGAVYNNYYGDAAVTYIVGECDEVGLKLVEVTKLALFKALDVVKAGARIGDISHAIQSTVEAYGFNVLRDYVGHGIGRQLHEEPEIPNYGQPGTGRILLDGMTLAIEVMACEGSYETKLLDDGWTVVMADGKRSAHFEHTVVVRKDCAEILTPW
ncbi:type I methionyl aminopeptidase [Pseudothermotoga thermarum]|uniref:Methionine aminopeptidase n=1 Tax=Pseudothermotoga thermarum DSM 5069 TaxID=688269 RepID=F7YY02_9THEM|nr:type I methionyl aminopeptidase [Pseudothermotoga thermarum]AEH50807.1 methionine aminopeptidase, type I [Pseudothermotoga thermarum DSM 5069]